MAQKHLVTKFLFGIALTALLLTACKKFYSYENGVIGLMIAKGTLQDSAGNCQNIVINGNYMQGAALTADNYITVQANITTAGKYSILTDTVNGCWFMDTGIVMSTGPQTFKVKGYGKPALPVFDVFSVRFAGTVCQFTIPTNKALYTFDAPAGACPNIVVNGSYMVGAALNATDTVTIPVHVTAAGTYNIQTPAVNGMLFAANGVFLKTGYYNVKLLGNGVPYVAETVSFPINVGAVGCSFAVATKVDTSMNWQFTANGITYKGYVQDSLKPFTTNDPTNPKNQFYGLQVQGIDYTSGNGILKGISFTIRRINNPWLPGIYHPIDTEKDFSCGFEYSKYDSLNGAGSFIFNTDILQPSFAINLQVIDTNSRLVQGIFSGPVYKKNNQNDPPDTIVNITNGYFKTYLAH